MSVVTTNQPYADEDKAMAEELAKIEDDVHDIYIWLKGQTWSEFAMSLAHFYERQGYLSSKQRASAESMRAKVEAKQAQAPKTSHGYDSPMMGKGYYTVTDDAGHKTFRISPNQAWAGGKTVIAVLTGPSNEFSYTGIGFVTDNGVQLWNSAKGKIAEYDRVANLIERLVADAEGAKQLTLEMAKQHVLTSENCFACGKLLTDPTSIEMGIGPVCRGDML